MKKTALLLMSLAVAMTIVVAGCSDTPNKNVARKNAKEKPKTVVVNKGLSEQEEKKLNERLDELEKKVGVQDEKASNATSGNGQPESSQQQVEDQVQAAAEAYYQAAADRDWGYTYTHLDSETQNAFTEDEWFAKNDQLADNGEATYTIQSIDIDNSSQESVANVAVLLTFSDGSTSLRNTYFVYEDGSWKHRFGSEEYNLFATAQAGTSSTSASSSASAAGSASASSGKTKHIKVIVSSNVPVDVSISDDNFDWVQQEEINGTKTYEHDIASDSGLTVSAANYELRGNVSIEVYENGSLKTQDSDSTGLAQVIY